jgi:hypothetical protein|tara:strand:+ start:1399 stop:1572 length:174 start_codon:yes stop_codon:yes gene_type:complete
MRKLEINKIQSYNLGNRLSGYLIRVTFYSLADFSTGSKKDLSPKRKTQAARFIKLLE